MKRYKEYKDSGIDWVGEIPSHWKTCRIKDCFFLKTGTTPNGFDKPIYDKEIHWFTPSDIESTGTILKHAERKLSAQIIKSENIALYPSGSLIFVGIGATAGKLGYLEIEGYSNQQITALIPKERCYSKYYFYYLIQDTNRIRENASFTTLPIINNTYLSQINWILPSLSEQKEIADYLDRKCGEIDAAVAKVDKELELLDELKQSEISKAVTKGLNPNVSFKPSGIDWIGEIPNHWKVVKLSRVLKGIQDGTHATLNRVENGEVLLSAKNVFEDGIRIDENESKISKEDYEAIIGNGYPKKGDILLCCVGTIGRGYIYNFDYPLAFQRSVTFLRIKEEFYNEFFLFSLRSLFSKIQFETFAKTSAQSGVYMGDLKKFLILLPPVTEQKVIADYLDKKCGEIDSLKEKLKQKKEKLQELRQSLISEVVTGKRKVI